MSKKQLSAQDLFTPFKNTREFRRRLGLNQQEFWGSIGVTQSGGSRYESGRRIPKPVCALLRIAYEDVTLAKLLEYVPEETSTIEDSTTASTEKK